MATVCNGIVVKSGIYDRFYKKPEKVKREGFLKTGTYITLFIAAKGEKVFP